MIGRRGFITGLVALVAAPAVIRVAPLMPISTRFTPLYVPAIWLERNFGALTDDKQTDPLFWKYGMIPQPLASDLKAHAWPRPLGEGWINLNDYDADYVRSWAKQIEEESWGRGQHWWGNEELET